MMSGTELQGDMSNGPNTPKITMYGMSEKELARLSNVFTYHAIIGDQQRRYIELRDMAKKLAVMVSVNCPESMEKSLALTKIQEAVMWANASITINEK